MNSLSDLLKTKGQNLRKVTTRVTLPSGRIFHEEDGVAVDCGQSFGFVVDTKPDLQVGRIENGLFVASQDVAVDSNLIAQHGITHILNVAGVPSIQKLPGLHYLDVFILDLPEELLSRHFPRCFGFINEAITNHGRVLVHCNAGISRSVSIVVAYLMYCRRLSLSEALGQVITARPKAQPNEGFMKQLQVYETSLLNEIDSPWK